MPFELFHRLACYVLVCRFIGHAYKLLQLVHNKANINAVNEHGNTALHYACFWGYDQIAEVWINLLCINTTLWIRLNC